MPGVRGHYRRKVSLHVSTFERGCGRCTGNRRAFRYERGRQKTIMARGVAARHRQTECFERDPGEAWQAHERGMAGRSGTSLLHVADSEEDSRVQAFRQ